MADLGNQIDMIDNDDPWVMSLDATDKKWTGEEAKTAPGPLLIMSQTPPWCIQFNTIHPKPPFQAHLLLKLPHTIASSKLAPQNSARLVSSLSLQCHSTLPFFLSPTVFCLIIWLFTSTLRCGHTEDKHEGSWSICHELHVALVMLPTFMSSTTSRWFCPSLSSSLLILRDPA